MASQIQATILKIGTAPLLIDSQSWSFPTDEIAIESVIDGGINSCIIWNGVKYYASETQQQLTNEANDSSASSFDIDVFLVAGQSNAQGQGDSSLSPIPQSGTVYQYYNSVFEEAQDPIGNAATGSAWPSFGIKWNNLTKRKICFVPAAVPSSSQVAAADPGGGTWDTTGTLFDTSVSLLNAAITALGVAGYTPVIRGILWCQGEADAGAITAATITKAQYKTALTTMIANYRTEFGSRLPFFIFRTGGADTVGRTDVMAAQGEVATSDYFTNLVFINAVNFPTRGLQNGAHYTQAGYNEMGDFGAVNVFQNATQEPISQLYQYVGIGTLLPTDNLHVVGTTRLEGAAVATSTLGVTGAATFSDSIGTNATTLTKDIGATANVWRIVYAGTINSGTGNALTLRSANTNQPVKFQNGATEAAQFALTTGNLLLKTTTDVPSSILTMNSTTQGFLPPRMTATQGSAISSPAEGLIIYVTNTNGTFTAKGWWGYDGAAWQKLNN